MLRIVLEIDGPSMPLSPMQVVEKYVLSPDLRRKEEDPKGLPMDYNHKDGWITVRVVEGEQI